MKINQPSNPDPFLLYKDKPDTCSRCPLYKIGRGFVRGVGPEDAKLSFCGEAPAADELIQKMPFAGKAGQVLRRWVFENAGVDPKEVYIDNVIRCAQPNNKLPEPKITREAVRICSQYDIWDKLKVDTDVLTFHPAALLRDPVPLPLVVADVGRARNLVATGKRVRVLLGATAIEKYYPFARQVRKWRGDVEDGG